MSVELFDGDENNINIGGRVSIKDPTSDATSSS